MKHSLLPDPPFQSPPLPSPKPSPSLSPLTTATGLEPPTLKTKAYSFQDLPSSSLLVFCNKITELHALMQIGKKITDPNVLMLNSTQKEMVEMIIDNNKHASDEKSKFLTQRAGKYVKLLWRTEKFNEAILGNEKKIAKAEPHYASPIHNFKKAKNNNSLEQRTERSASGRSIVAPMTQRRDSAQPSSRVKRGCSEDQKFSNVRLSHFDKKKKEQKPLQVDLTRNMAWRTINTTRNFDNMLKILKKEE